MNYIGSKLSILDFIDDTVNDLIPNIDAENTTFCDIFSGTATVSKHFKKKGFSVISNDIEYYGFVTARHFVQNNKKITFSALRESGIDDPFEFLNGLVDVKGFIYNNYSLSGTKDSAFQRQYFSDENAIKIDSIRTRIEAWNNQGLLNKNEYYFLIASLIESADKVANTASVYEAFLKHLKSTAKKTLFLKPVETIANKNCRTLKAYNTDCNKLIKTIKGDVLYMDPPYNTRKYDTNYHMLETIALYDNPEIKGKTGVRADTSKRSKYCRKADAVEAFEDLVKNANFKYILLSYNDEGIIPIEKISSIMSKYGTYKRYERQHRRFKADSNRKYLKNSTTEYLHCLIKV